MTRPESWTPHSVFAATRIFVSASGPTAERFMHSVLLPAVQDNIRETHRLDVHLYDALKKGLYKPTAFFKGIVFPLLSGSCTQREAQIVASAVARVSVPVMASAAALCRLCEMAAEQMSADADAAGPTNIFIKTLLEKRYALPFQVVDALVLHFVRFSVAPGVGAKLPVIWHQGLLVFAQRFRDELAEDQRQALLDLLHSRWHPDISPEVRRELLAGREVGTVANEEIQGGDDTMATAVDG